MKMQKGKFNIKETYNYYYLWITTKEKKYLNETILSFIPLINIIFNKYYRCYEYQEDVKASGSLALCTFLSNCNIFYTDEKKFFSRACYEIRKGMREEFYNCTKEKDLIDIEGLLIPSEDRQLHSIERRIYAKEVKNLIQKHVNSKIRFNGDEKKECIHILKHKLFHRKIADNNDGFFKSYIEVLYKDAREKFKDYDL